MNRRGFAFTQAATRSAGPLSTPMMLRRSAIASVWFMTSSSVVGDQIGSAQAGFLSFAMNRSPYGVAASHAEHSGKGVHIASGGGPWASAASACMCTSMIGSRCCAAVGIRRVAKAAMAARALMAAQYTPRSKTLVSPSPGSLAATRQRGLIVGDVGSLCGRDREVITVLSPAKEGRGP
jgi:hypothetical protein